MNARYTCTLLAVSHFAAHQNQLLSYFQQRNLAVTIRSVNMDTSRMHLPVGNQSIVRNKKTLLAQTNWELGIHLFPCDTSISPTLNEATSSEQNKREGMVIKMILTISCRCSALMKSPRPINLCYFLYIAMDFPVCHGTCRYMPTALL